jgi:hypothetical protein
LLSTGSTADGMYLLFPNAIEEEDEWMKDCEIKDTIALMNATSHRYFFGLTIIVLIPTTNPSSSSSISAWPRQRLVYLLCFPSLNQVNKKHST